MCSRAYMKSSADKEMFNVESRLHRKAVQNDDAYVIMNIDSDE